MPTADRVIEFNAQLFYVSLEFLSAFLCWFSAMLFRAPLAGTQFLPKNLFRPHLFWAVGTLHFIHAAVLLAFPGLAYQRVLGGERFIQLLLCGAMILYARAQSTNPRHWTGWARAGGLLVCVIYCLAVLVISPHYPSGAGVALAWLLAFSAAYDRPYLSVLMPVSFRAFCLLGVIAQLTAAAGSHQFLDGPFFLSTLIQTTQYGFLAGSLMTSHFFGYSTQVWATRQVLGDTREQCQQAEADLTTTRQLISEAQSHISLT